MPKCYLCSAETERSGARCAKCNSAYMKEYRTRNIEKVKAGQKDHYLRNKARVIEKVKEYATKNKEKIKTARAKKYDETREIRRAKIKEWQDKNPEKRKEIARASCLNRIARKRKAEGAYSVRDVRRIYNEQKGLCLACGKSLLSGYHVDHIVPLAKGGDNWPSNLQLLCPSCNMSKGAQTMERFLERKAAC